MKILDSGTPVEMSENLKVQDFKIKATAKAFKILSDGLYSDKITAVIRELSCNAFDSHVQAGRRDVPFEVHIPTIVEPYFSVKDFGVGLSDKGIMHLYTTYFESSKNETNDMIGGLGLGSKSPFSYTDNFTVVSNFDGMQRVYTAFLNSHGFPSITKFNESSTTEPNGIEVKVPVKANDFAEFQSKATRVLTWFNPKPKFNINMTFPDYIWAFEQTTNWNVAKNMHESYIIMGNIRYPYRRSPINGLHIFLDIGDVEIAASREDISYTPETDKFLANKLKQIQKEMAGRITDTLKNVTSLSDPILINLTSSYLISNLGISDKFDLIDKRYFLHGNQINFNEDYLKPYHEEYLKIAKGNSPVPATFNPSWLSYTTVARGTLNTAVFNSVGYNFYNFVRYVQRACESSKWSSEKIIIAIKDKDTKVRLIREKIMADNELNTLVVLQHQNNKFDFKKNPEFKQFLADLGLTMKNVVFFSDVNLENSTGIKESKIRIYSPSGYKSVSPAAKHQITSIYWPIKTISNILDTYKDEDQMFYVTYRLGKHLHKSKLLEYRSINELASRLCGRNSSKVPDSMLNKKKDKALPIIAILDDRKEEILKELSTKFKMIELTAFIDTQINSVNLSKNIDAYMSYLQIAKCNEYSSEDSYQAWLFISKNLKGIDTTIDKTLAEYNYYDKEMKKHGSFSVFDSLLADQMESKRKDSEENYFLNIIFKKFPMLSLIKFETFRYQRYTPAQLKENIDKMKNYISIVSKLKVD